MLIFIPYVGFGIGLILALIAGLLQFNVKVPPDVQPGPAVPLVFSVGGVSSPTNVTVAIR